LYTIQNEKGRLKNLRVVMGGDLAHGRTVRSLSRVLALYPGNHITYVSTPGLQIGDDIKEYITQRGATFDETDDMMAALKDADVVTGLACKKSAWLTNR
jgi:aspartate carbamoyltransferase catalytic subunit